MKRQTNLKENLKKEKKVQPKKEGKKIQNKGIVSSKKEGGKINSKVKERKISVKRQPAQSKVQTPVKKGEPVKAVKVSDKVLAVKGGKSDKKILKVRFLGGVGEIGKNMTALEFGKDIIVIDAGLTFPGDNMPGVDLVIPDVSWLAENKSRIRGIIITHGHEDHIGSLPYVLRDINAPIFATKLTLTLIENKIREHNLNNVSLNCIKPQSVIKLGCFSIEFINVNHSIAGAVGLSITTPVGVVFHTGDFKIDFTPVNSETIDLSRIAEIGKKGVLLLMADSTNIEVEGSTMSESVVKDAFEHIFTDNFNRRLIIATFASNVHRLQQILDLAQKYKRKVAFSGRSMINIAESASKIGELTIPQNLIIDVEKTKSFKDEQIVIISTGTQGEPMSALTRMARGEFNKVVIGERDTVVISASVIPGNEKMIYGVINDLYKKGAEVIYESLEPLHVSGHACREELRVLHSLVKPKFFIPVHGEYRHLKKHAKLAESVGVNKNGIVIAEIGDTVELTANSIKKGESFKAGSRFVDGVGIDGADSFVLRDRIHLSEDGLIVVVVGVDGLSGQATSVEIVGKGIVMNDTSIQDWKQTVKDTLDKIDVRTLADENELSGIIRRSLKNFIFKATKKNPMILPVVMKV